MNIQPTPQKSPQSPTIVRVNRQRKDQTNREYIHVAKGFRLGKIITLILLLTFVTGMVAVRRDELTVENFQYLMRFLANDANIYTYETGSRTITFNAVEEMTADLYRSDVVVAGSGKLTIFTTGGNTVMDDFTAVTYPVLRSGKTRLLLYDRNGYSFTVYNSFSALHSETLDYPIYAGAMADNGSFAIVTRSQDYRSVVQIYNKEYKIIARISKDKLITDLKFNEKGDRLLIASLYAGQNGDCTGEIMIVDPSSDQAIACTEVEDFFPLAARYNSHGFSVLGDNALLFYDSSANLIARYPFEGEKPSSFAFHNDYIFLAFPQNVMNSRTRVMIFAADGQYVKTKLFPADANRMLFDENRLYLLDSHTIHISPLDSDSLYTVPIQAGANNLLPIDEHTLLLCANGQVQTLQRTALQAEVYLTDLSVAWYEEVDTALPVENEQPLPPVQPAETSPTPVETSPADSEIPQESAKTASESVETG